MLGRKNEMGYGVGAGLEGCEKKENTAHTEVTRRECLTKRIKTSNVTMRESKIKSKHFHRFG